MQAFYIKYHLVGIGYGLFIAIVGLLYYRFYCKHKDDNALIIALTGFAFGGAISLLNLIYLFMWIFCKFHMMDKVLNG